MLTIYIDSVTIILREIWLDLLDEVSETGIIFSNQRDSIADILEEDVQNLNAENLIEQNRKTIWHIYLKTIARQNYNFESGDIESVLDIANLCPDFGGEVVYDARVLYSYYNDDVLFSDYEICNDTIYSRYQETFQEPSEKTPIAETITIFPNPAEKFVNIKFNIKSHGEIIIRSIRNDVVEKRLVTKENNACVLNTENYSPGIYIVELQTSRNRIVQKISILR